MTTKEIGTTIIPSEFQKKKETALGLVIFIILVLAILTIIGIAYLFALK